MNFNQIKFQDKEKMKKANINSYKISLKFLLCVFF